MKRYLGIDMGEKRVGLAISDASLTIAQPLMTLPFKKMDLFIVEIKRLIEAHSIKKIIVGLPLTMKGTFSEKTREVEQAIEILQANISIPVEKFDERLTTVQAEATLRAMGKKPSRERNRIDQLAAAHLLQCYLDREAGGRI